LPSVAADARRAELLALKQRLENLALGDAGDFGGPFFVGQFQMRAPTTQSPLPDGRGTS